MEIILMERIEKLGQMGDVVSVRPGYARNYLLPQKKAMRATKQNLAVFEGQRAQLEAQNLERRKDAEAVAEKLDGMSVVLIRQAGESGQLYGSVNARDLAESVTANGVTVERRQISLDNVIKTLGLHSVRVTLHPEVSVSIMANVARSDDEAQTQAKTGRMVSAEELREAEEAVEAELESIVETVEAEEHQADTGEAADGADNGDGQASEATEETTA
ncbi:MAG: 50S ribosomal protein L9 [Pseudomonadota bacterium]